MGKKSYFFIIPGAKEAQLCSAEMSLEFRPLEGPNSQHKTSSLPPTMTHKLEQNKLAAKYRITPSSLHSRMCSVRVYGTFLESLLLISCLASCSSTSFFSASTEPTGSFHISCSGCNMFTLLFITLRCDAHYSMHVHVIVLT